MKKHNTLLALLLITVLSYAQDGAEHKITNIIGAGRVEINIGEQFDVKLDDVFQVFGRGQIIHPATGSLVERDNVYLGRIKIIEVRALSSIAETIERRGDFSIGNRIIKVASEDQEVVEHKRPVQAEFERPRDRSYSETIYTQREEKTKPDNTVRIISIEESENKLLAVINKGRASKAEGGTPSIGKNYHLFVPIVEVSEITGQQRISGEEYIGDLVIEDVEHDASKGSLQLKKDVDLSFIERDNLLRTYIPKGRGVHYIISITSASLNPILNDKPAGFMDGIYFNYGYMTNRKFFVGAITGYNVAYHASFTEAKILNMPLLANVRYVFNTKKVAPLISFTLGRNFVLNSNHENRYYTINGGLHASTGFGFLSYANRDMALLFELNLEYSAYNFNYEEGIIEYFYGRNFKNIPAIKFNIGFTF